MADITVKELIAYVDALPADCVLVETAVKNNLIPIVAAVAATRNAALCHTTDALSLSLFNLEVKVNGWAQRLADSVDAFGLYAVLVGGYVIPGSGAVIDELEKLVAQATDFQSSVAAHNEGSLAAAKAYLSQFSGAMRLVLGLVPSLAGFSVDGINLAMVLDGLEEVAKAV